MKPFFIRFKDLATVEPYKPKVAFQNVIVEATCYNCNKVFRKRFDELNENGTYIIECDHCGKPNAFDVPMPVS